MRLLITNIIFILFFQLAYSQVDTNVVQTETEGLIIQQDDATESGTKDEHTSKYLSADSVADDNNIDEDESLAEVRENIAMRIFEIQKNFNALQNTDKAQPKVEAKVSEQFENLVAEFAKVNGNGKYEDEIAKLNLMLDDFNAYRKLDGTPKIDAFIALYGTWQELNIDITKAFNTKFKK